MSNATEDRMSATDGDRRLAKRIFLVARYLLLPLAIVLVVLKLVGGIGLSWWLVLLPGLIYAVHPMVIGVLGVLLQHRRYRERQRNAGSAQ